MNDTRIKCKNRKCDELLGKYRAKKKDGLCDGCAAKRNQLKNERMKKRK